MQRWTSRLTTGLSRPGVLIAITALVVVWVALNLGLSATGRFAPDPPPFVWTEGAVSLASLYMVLLILSSQRTDDALAKRRELLGIELAILSEQKTAKVIQLLEELRRDTPNVPDRVDQQAAVMAAPSDPGSVIQAIQERSPGSDPDLPA